MLNEADHDEAVVLLRGHGQHAFPQLVKPYLDQIDFDLNDVASRWWPIVSSDRQILHRPHERAVLKELNMGAFFFNDTIRGLCKIARTTYRHFPEMKRLASVQPRPFLNLLRETTITPIRRKSLGHEA